MIGAIAAQAVRPVHAGPDPSDADRLFEEGRTLAKQNRFAEACERFTKSDAIQRTFGTAVNLGDCAKRDGHAGLAWQLYDDASRFADRDGATDLAKFARQRASSVASALCTIIVTIEDPAAGMTVRIGGHQVTPAAEIHELVEPGEVDVVVAIPSATRLVRSARCSAAGELATVTFPADRLRVVERSPSPAPPSPPAGRATVPHGLIAEANVGIAAADVVGGAGWLPYVAFDATVSGWASSRLAIGGPSHGTDRRLVGAGHAAFPEPSGQRRPRGLRLCRSRGSGGSHRTSVTGRGSGARGAAGFAHRPHVRARVPARRKLLTVCRVAYFDRGYRYETDHTRGCGGHRLDRSLAPLIVSVREAR